MRTQIRKYKSFRNKGLTLVEVVISLVSLSLLLVVSADVIGLAFKNLKIVELTTERDIVKSYIRNLAFNTTSQVSWRSFDAAKSYYSNGSNYTPVGLFKPESAPIFTIESSKNVPNPGSFLAPFVSSKMNGTAVDIYQDSFTFMNSRIRVVNGEMIRTKGYVIASRCVPLTSSRVKDGNTIDENFPLVSAMYTINVLQRRPFIVDKQNGSGREIRCCPLDKPGTCTDGSLSNFQAKIFVISLDENSLPISVEEIPEPSNKSILNTGMMLVLDRASEPSLFTTIFFSHENRCIRSTFKKNCPIIKVSKLFDSTNADVKQIYSQYDEYMKKTYFEWSGQVVRPLAHTGVIELGF